MSDELLTLTAVRGLVAAAVGGTAEVVGLERLRGGSKKGVFRVPLAGGAAVVLYVWHESEDWWSTVREADGDPADPFADASALTLFAAAQQQLAAREVRVPEVLLLDDTGAHLDADVAVVEDVPGGSLEDLLADDPPAAGPVLRRLRHTLQRMESATHPSYGKVGAEGMPQTSTFPALVLRRALHHLASAATREARIARSADRLGDALRDRAAAVRPRAGYCLVHGELGPDHVRIDGQGQPVLIDVEGLMWADAEWEHAFLELRFGPHYAALRAPGLDPARLLLYRLALHLSLVEGPLRLLETGFPDAEETRAIAEHNLVRALATIS